MKGFGNVLKAKQISTLVDFIIASQKAPPKKLLPFLLKL
jgi:hypothetical protein